MKVFFPANVVEENTIDQSCVKLLVNSRRRCISRSSAKILPCICTTRLELVVQGIHIRNDNKIQHGEEKKNKKVVVVFMCAVHVPRVIAASSLTFDLHVW